MQFDNPMIPRRKEEINSALQARNEAKQELTKSVPIFVNPFIHSESDTFLLSMHHSLFMEFSTVEWDGSNTYPSVMECSCLMNAFSIS